MRGKVGWSAERSGPEGITPAYAGKRAPHPAGGLEGQDHPRVCGEKFPRSDTGRHRRGSPPRMRGKAVPSGASSIAVGITPAYAGKS